MLINEKIEVHGSKVVLVPYERNMVPKYHDWMQSEDLLAATASERLSLDQEYEMQLSWRRDSDKLTFIVLDKTKMAAGEIEAMIGDTNLFLKQEGVAEIMIMIAETSCRRRGLGLEALLLILRYGIENLNIKEFQAIISSDNLASINLFQRLGFVKQDENKIFNEITFTKIVPDNWEWTETLSQYTIVQRGDS